MKLKEGVQLFGLKKVMRPVLMYCDELWKEHGKEFVVTETVGGLHSPGSLHPFGEAIDCRTRYFNPIQIDSIAKTLKKNLRPKGYDIVVHTTHIHIEYDPK